jgi:branched-chain amino acid transport system substrate-binding protein
MDTIVGPISYNKDGEWAQSRMLMIQFRGIKDKNLEQWREPGKQVVLYPPQYKTGDAVMPFDKARGK